LVSGGIIEYGAIERYSGYSDIDYNYVVAYQNSAANSDESPLKKFQLRLLAKQKAAYIKVSLLCVWTTINRLLTLLGATPQPRPNFADWSFQRDVYPIIKPANGSLRFRSLAELLQNTVPSDTAAAPGIYSLRSLLAEPVASAPPPAEPPRVSYVSYWPPYDF
jgi:hypothetical protein